MVLPFSATILDPEKRVEALDRLLARFDLDLTDDQKASVAVTLDRVSPHDPDVIDDLFQALIDLAGLGLAHQVAAGTASAGPVLVLYPGATPAGNVYADLPSLMAARASIRGPWTLALADDVNVTEIADDPDGWDLTNVSIVSIEPNASRTLSLAFADNVKAKVAGLLRIIGVGLNTSSSATVITLAGAIFLDLDWYASIAGSATAALIETGEFMALIRAGFYTGIYAYNGHEAIDAGDSGYVDLRLAGPNAQLDANAIRGTAGSTLNVELGPWMAAHTTLNAQGNFTGTYQPTTILPPALVGNAQTNGYVQYDGSGAATTVDLTGMEVASFAGATLTEDNLGINLPDGYEWELRIHGTIQASIGTTTAVTAKTNASPGQTVPVNSTSPSACFLSKTFSGASSNPVEIQVAGTGAASVDPTVGFVATFSLELIRLGAIQP